VTYLQCVTDLRSRFRLETNKQLSRAMCLHLGGSKMAEGVSLSDQGQKSHISCRRKNLAVLVRFANFASATYSDTSMFNQLELEVFSSCYLYWIWAVEMHSHTFSANLKVISVSHHIAIGRCKGIFRSHTHRAIESLTMGPQRIATRLHRQNPGEYRHRRRHAPSLE